MKKILFYLAQEYYWPSLKPVYDSFNGEENVKLYLKIGKNSKRYFKLFLVSQRNKIERKFVKQGYNITRKVSGFDAVFCGAQIKDPQRFGNALLVNLDHGPGIKTLRYRHLQKEKASYVCFLEGQYRIEKFRKYGLDKIHDIYDVGLPKLDVFFNNYYNEKAFFNSLNLDKNKKTILYAPSYKPTSIFMIGQQVAALSELYNVIVKLHPYSWGGKYASHAQHRLFEKMVKKYPDLYLVSKDDHNILPYMYISDTMISDGSSVINEFLALGRCGIIVDLDDESLKHSDGQPLLEDKSSEWLKDSFIHISEDDSLQDAVHEALNPSDERRNNIKKDKKYIFSYTDGKSADRVKNITMDLLKRRS